MGAAVEGGCRRGAEIVAVAGALDGDVFAVEEEAAVDGELDGADAGSGF